MQAARGEESAGAETVEGALSYDAAPLGIGLRCPRCHAGVPSLSCLQCGFTLRVDRGIAHALPLDRATHYSQFIEDYEQIRAAEGRGSDSDEFYLGLPYCDVTGRNSKQWQIRARTYDCLLGQVLKPSLPAGGRILDMGAGNCWMSFRLALAGYKPIAVDLLTNQSDGLEAAEHYRNHLPRLFPRFQAELENLPFQSGQLDAAIFNASLHYAEDAEGALREALRCVRSGGMVIVADTPWYSREESGRQMVSERRASFLRRYGTASASIERMEYLTGERLQASEEGLSIRWTIYSPRYGLRWAMRPLLAKLRNKREPARFRIYVARKAPA
jgi:SAM-dependent methyltransferase